MEHDFIVARQGKVFKKRRFNVIDRAVEKARREILEQENTEIFKVLDSIFELEHKDGA